MTTELNSIANNGLAISSAFDNTQAADADGRTTCELELYVTHPTAPTANTGWSIWFLRAIDGTNYEDGGTSLTPARAADLVIGLRNVNSAQRQTRETSMPVGKFKVLTKNDGTGQASASSGNTLKIRPSTRESA
jgi:hypothetical protein